jgi:hypothetical protein
MRRSLFIIAISVGLALTPGHGASAAPISGAVADVQGLQLSVKNQDHGCGGRPCPCENVCAKYGSGGHCVQVKRVCAGGL